MSIYVEGFIWLDWVVEKILVKHDVYPPEAEEAFDDPSCKVRRAEEGKYRLYGRAASGRYLFVIFAWEGRLAKIISVRNMTEIERRYYGRK